MADQTTRGSERGKSSLLGLHRRDRGLRYTEGGPGSINYRHTEAKGQWLVRMDRLEN